ncbi:hypothetical protein DN730_03280 [Marinomonas piezotolerans]|uniref:Chromosome partition protein Smc n=1 Tax=Marinomonas piezotolerans TaxID=2213058 RepID=A0A370UEC7_9GAMM|nr:hypothetical protein [Marinomonas piezotolerans]RDL46075.1 hypothetical protein DN730_03280 [Marinomonas piezotolerans]
MKNSMYLTSIALSVMLSACSTTSSNDDNASLVDEVSPTKVAEEQDPKQVSASNELKSQPEPVSSGTSSTNDQTAFLTDSQSKDTNQEAAALTYQKKEAERNQQIERLKRQLAQNSEQITELTQRLDEKEQQLSSLMTQENDSDWLQRIETLKAERDQLEVSYNQLRLENDQLTKKIEVLEVEKQQALAANASQQQDFIELNKSFRTLDSAHYALSKNYRDLSIEHAHLKSKYKTLSDQKSTLQAQYDSLNKENLKLGGALSEARAQHQVLWDKIRVQGNVINALEEQNAKLERGGSLLVSEPASRTDEDSLKDSAALRSEITRLKAEINAQNGLISDYQNDVVALERELSTKETDLANKLSELNAKYQQAKTLNSELKADLEVLRTAIANQDIKIQQLRQQLADSTALKEQYREEMATLREGHVAAQAEVEQLSAEVRAVNEDKANLERQVNNLIPFEGAVMSLQQQLRSELDDVRWDLPTMANLNDAFEIQLSARVENPVQGQTYYAELFVDSALNMMSASEAEATVDNGAINFRWRLSGLNERPNAMMNVSVTQSLNYDGQTILRKVYRDHATVELVSDDWLSKYGYWLIAILAGLLVGFGVGKIGRKSD